MTRHRECLGAGRLDNRPVGALHGSVLLPEDGNMRQTGAASPTVGAREYGCILPLGFSPCNSVANCDA